MRPGRLVLFFALISISLPLSAKQKLCVVVPVTGQYAALGKRVVQAVTFQVNRDGCGLGVQAFDTIGTAGGATQALTDVSNDDDCLVVIGGIGDKTGKNVATWASIWGIPVILLSGGEGVIQDEWVTRLRPSRVVLFEDLAGLVVKSGMKAGFMTCSQDTFQDEACTAFARGVQSSGGSVIQRIDCGEPKACAAQLASAMGKKKGHFFIFTPFALSDAIRFHAFLSYMQVSDRLTLVGGPMLDVPALLLRRSAELEGLLFGDVFSSVLNPELDRQYRRVTGHGLSSLEVWAMDSAGFVCQAFMNGVNTRDAVRSFFEQTKTFQGVAGGYFKLNSNDSNTDEWHNFIRLFKVHGENLEPLQ